MIVPDESSSDPVCQRSLIHEALKNQPNLPGPDGPLLEGAQNLGICT